MQQIVLPPEPLTASAFAAFGDVVETDAAQHFAINAGTIERYHDLANVQIDYSNGGRPVVSIATVTTATGASGRVTLVERHPHGSQAFIPMFDNPVVLVVAPPADSVPPQNLRAFVTNGRQGFNYHRGTWHMPLRTDAVGRQFLIVDREGPGQNCDEWHFDEVVVTIG